MSEYLYITPKLEVLNSVERDSSMENPFKPKNYIQNFEELFLNDFMIIIGEPGDGKSRLLKEIVLLSPQKNKKGIFLDLKKIKNESIENKLKQILSAKSKSVETNEQISSIKDYFYSEQFELSKDLNNIIVCFDALDEVKRDDMFDIIEKIKQFKTENPLVQVVLSCRSYIYKRYNGQFQELSPRLIQVAPFDIKDVRNFLSHHNFQESDINKVVERFFRGFNFNIINSPRILEIFVSIKEKEGLENALKKNKAQLLENFIYGELKEEGNKTNKNQIEIIKRVLEKLALIMEIYQTNEISKDELMTFFDDVDSSLSQAFLQQVNIDDFYDRYLLVHSANGEHIQFQNVEFQEYLAAKEITRLGRTDQIAFDIVVNKDLQEIYPTWANSIKYLIELCPELNFPVIEYICLRGSSNNFNLLYNIILTEVNNISSLSVGISESVFKLVLKTHNELKEPISSALTEKIVLYYSAGMDVWLKDLVNETNNEDVVLENIITIVDCLLENNKTIDLDFWKEKVLVFLRNDKSTDFLKRISIKSLSNFKDINLLKSNFDYKKNNSENLISAFIHACQKADPNDPFTIDLIVENIRIDNINRINQENFEDVTSLNGIKYMLRKFIDTEGLVRSYDSIYDKYKLERIISNIDNVYNADIKGLVNELILLPGSDFRHDKFITAIVKYIGQKDNEYIFELIENIAASNSYNWFNHNEIFYELLNTENIEKFIQLVNSKENWREPIAFMFLTNKSDTDEKKKVLFEISKKYYEAEFKKIETKWEENNKTWDRSVAIYEKFKTKLAPSPGKYNLDVFEYYQQNRDVINKLIKPEDTARIKELIYDTILIFDFSKAHVTITSHNDNSKHFSLSSWIHTFGGALKLFSEFEIDLTKHRIKILEYLPFSFSNDLKSIFTILGDLTSSDVADLITFYQIPRQDDLFVSNVNNFFEILRHYRLIEGMPILKGIVTDKKYEIHYRCEALSLIRLLNQDIEFFKIIFDKYLNEAGAEEIRLVNIANEYLIVNDNKYREEAINWRIEKIIDEPQIKDPTTIGHNHIEYRANSFNQPLYDVSNRRFINEYLKLLDGSIEIYNKGKGYHSYSISIWNTVFAYFDNLKSYKSFAPIQELENRILKYSKFDGFNLLKNYYNRIKLNYVNVVGKPTTFSECITSYNELKEKKYLSISSAADFYYLIKDIIEVDIKKWVEKEGAYDFISKISHEEDLIQKTIKTQFENGLLKRGLRDSEVRIRREEQLLSDKRTDFVISYGFIGQILIEIKRTMNPDVKDPLYSSKLLEYIVGTKSDYCIFLIFQTDDKNVWSEMEPKVAAIYQEHTDKIKVIGLNCIAGNYTQRKKLEADSKTKTKTSKKKTVK